MKSSYLGALLAATALSSAAVAQAPADAPRPTNLATAADCDRLIAVLETQRPANPGITVEQARTYRTQSNVQGCRAALARVDPAFNSRTAQADDPSRVVVQQTSPTVRVQQGSPQVTVAQPQPNVTVNQGVPQITVRQPAPTVTVDIPQPEVTVRMPRPDVNVAMAQPQVQVSQPRPQVQVAQPGQPQVQVEPGQPQVNVQRAAGTQPHVTIEGGGQAQVQYERAQPKVVVNQATGQPTVHVEHAEPNARRANADATRPDATAGDRAAATGSLGASNQQMLVSRVTNLNVFNATGNQVGDVERVVTDPNGKPHIVIGHGGFLGLGEKHVAIPLERAELQGDRLVVQGLTDDQIRAMPAWDSRSGNLRELNANQSVQVATRS